MLLGGIGGSILDAFLKKGKEDSVGDVFRNAGRNLISNPFMGLGMNLGIGGQILGRELGPPAQSAGQQFADQFLQRRKRYLDYLRSTGLGL